jgi:hypothetical protein
MVPRWECAVIQRGRATGAGEELIVVDTHGAVLRRLTAGELFSDSVSWAPAETIAYVEDKGDSTQDKCGS